MKEMVIGKSCEELGGRDGGEVVGELAVLRKAGLASKALPAPKPSPDHYRPYLAHP